MGTLTDKIDKAPYQKFYVFFFSVLAFGMSMGEIFMSISSIAVAVVWIVERDFSNKWTRIKELKYAPLAFLIIYFVHLVWLANTSDISIGLRDIELKLPLLCYPIVLGSIAVFNKKQWLIIIFSFLLGIFINSFVGFWLYYGGESFNSNRELSIFISHIRLSLMIGISIFIAGWLILHLKDKRKYLLVLFILPVLWYLRLLESGTGYIVLLVIGFVFLIYLTTVFNYKWLKLSLVFSVIVFGIASFFYIQNIHTSLTKVTDKNDLSNLDTYSAGGEFYLNDLHGTWLENGNYIWLYIAPKETERAWNRVSDIKFDSTDRKDQPIYSTLYRYLTSRGLRKDSLGVAQLSEVDIQNIQEGLATIVPPKSGFTARVEKVVYEFINYQMGHNPNGHSVIQRYHFVQAGLEIFKENRWLGIGTGDEKTAYDAYYEKVNSPLLPENRLRAHNQFISFLVCFGLIGSLLLLFALGYPLFTLPLNILAIISVLIIYLSFLSDDTMDTQAGVTFVSFFYCFFLFQKVPKI